MREACTQEHRGRGENLADRELRHELNPFQNLVYGCDTPADFSFVPWVRSSIVISRQELNVFGAFADKLALVKRKYQTARRRE
jgi:hypothetical protein